MQHPSAIPTPAGFIVRVTALSDGVPYQGPATVPGPLTAAVNTLQARPITARRPRAGGVSRGVRCVFAAVNKATPAAMAARDDSVLDDIVALYGVPSSASPSPPRPPGWRRRRASACASRIRRDTMGLVDIPVDFHTRGAAMRVLVRYGSFSLLVKACSEQIARGNLFLSRELNQPQFAAIAVLVEAPDGERFELPCEVLQGFPGACALTITAAARSAQDALLAHAMQHAGDAGDDVTVEVLVDEEIPPDADEADDADDADDATVDKSLAAQVAAMSLAEKRQAALHGNKDLRLLILKDHNKTLHPFVLKNPAVSVDEVEAVSRMTSVNPECLHLIAKDWARSPSIVRNLVKNPKTPLQDAVALVDKLAVSDLRAVAKGGAVRMAILTAARKKVSQP